MTIFSISDGSTLSSEAWMRAAATSSGPHRMNSARGAAPWSLRSSGMEPPEPASPTGFP